jgi:hypothetical protein
MNLQLVQPRGSTSGEPTFQCLGRHAASTTTLQSPLARSLVPSPSTCRSGGKRDRVSLRSIVGFRICLVWCVVSFGWWDWRPGEYICLNLTPTPVATFTVMTEFMTMRYCQSLRLVDWFSHCLGSVSRRVGMPCEPWRGGWYRARMLVHTRGCSKKNAQHAQMLTLSNLKLHNSSIYVSVCNFCDSTFYSPDKMPKL